VPFLRDHLDKFPWQMGWPWHRLHNYNDYKTRDIQMHRMHNQKGWIIWCPHLLHEVLEIWPLLTPNWKHLPHPIEKKPSWGEGPRCTWCHGLLFHIRTWLLLWINVERNVLQRHSEIESIKCVLWIDTMFPSQ
jgi:hypothetical protein